MWDKEKEKLFDNEIDRDILINLVQQRPVLWNKYSEEYKNKTAKTTAWWEICVILKKDFEEMEETDRQFYGRCVVKRWTQLRDTWLKSLNEQKDNKKSGSATKPRPYKYDQELSFLKPIVKLAGTHDNNPKTKKHDVAKKDTKTKHNLETTGSETSSKSKQRKIDSISIVDDKVSKPVNYQVDTIGNNDRNLNFFKSVLPSLQFFNDDQILEFQSGVISLIQSIKTGQNHSNWPENYNNQDSYTIQSPIAVYTPSEFGTSSSHEECTYKLETLSPEPSF